MPHQDHPHAPNTGPKSLHLSLNPVIRGDHCIVLGDRLNAGRCVRVICDVQPARVALALELVFGQPARVRQTRYVCVHPEVLWDDGHQVAGLPYIAADALQLIAPEALL